MDFMAPAAQRFLEIDQSPSGRWIARVPELPTVVAEAPNREDVLELALGGALRVLADLIGQSRAADSALDFEEIVALSARLIGAFEDEIDLEAALAARLEPSLAWGAVRDDL
jgi:hypothetical protein